VKEIVGTEVRKSYIIVRYQYRCCRKLLDVLALENVAGYTYDTV